MNKKEYIYFYFDNNNHFIAEIHINGKVKKVTSDKNLKLLLKICARYNYIVDREGFINTDVKLIANDYEKVKNRNKNRNKNKHNLNLYNIINGNMRINRRKSNKKSNGLVKYLPFILAGTIIVGSAAINNHKNKSNEGQNPINEISMNTEDDIEYYSSEEDLQQDIQNRTAQMIKKQGESINNEIEKMVAEQTTFHFSYEDRSNSENLENARRYQDVFEKYGHMYGVDPNLLMAIAAQESSGNHYNHIEDGPACGIMQIEKSVHIDSTITAYNYETEEYDSLEITEDNIKKLDTNVRIAAMLLQNCIRLTYPNIAQAIQTYNFGAGNMCDVLDAYEENENISRDDAIKRINDDKWLEYRNVVPVGDEKYLEHVLSYIPTNTITILDSNGNPLKIKIQNDYNKQNIY